MNLGTVEGLNVCPAEGSEVAICWPYLSESIWQEVESLNLTIRQPSPASCQGTVKGRFNDDDHIYYGVYDVQETGIEIRTQKDM